MGKRFGRWEGEFTQKDTDSFLFIAPQDSTVSPFVTINGQTTTFPFSCEKGDIYRTETSLSFKSNDPTGGYLEPYDIFGIFQGDPVIKVSVKCVPDPENNTTPIKGPR